MAVPALTPEARYARCEQLVVTLEGAYADNPKDAGGPTKWGVTLRALEAARGCACTAADVAALTKPEVLQLYRTPYWDAVRGDALPAGVDLITFDAAVNCGRGRAVTFLQAAMGVAIDGDFGPRTLAALGQVRTPKGLIERIRQVRASYYARLPRADVFGAGWSRRLATVATTATAWAARAAA